MQIDTIVRRIEVPRAGGRAVRVRAASLSGSSTSTAGRSATST